MFELLLRAPQNWVEPVSDLLMDELAALSVSVEDADAGTEGERALFGEPGMPAPAAGWQRSTLTALFETEAAAEGAASVVLARHAADGVHVQALSAIAEQDWVRITQQQFAPVEITPTFWVVPSWHQPPAAATHVMRLDPGVSALAGHAAC
jgi:ribosomal protein L11 methyltransferase